MCWFRHKWEVVKRSTILVDEEVRWRWGPREIRVLLVLEQCTKCGKKRARMFDGLGDANKVEVVLAEHLLGL